MKRSQRMKPVLQLAEREEQLLALRSQQARAQQAAAADKLQQLRDYHSEYSQRGARSATGTLDLARLQETRQFLRRLADAIAVQEQEVRRQMTLCSEAERAWISSRQRSQSLEGLVDQYRSQERDALARSEQARADDLSSQRHVWLAGQQ